MFSPHVVATETKKRTIGSGLCVAILIHALSSLLVPLKRTLAPLSLVVASSAMGIQSCPCAIGPFCLVSHPPYLPPPFQLKLLKNGIKHSALWPSLWDGKLVRFMRVNIAHHLSLLIYPPLHHCYSIPLNSTFHCFLFIPSLPRHVALFEHERQIRHEGMALALVHPSSSDCHHAFGPRPCCNRRKSSRGH